MADINNDQSHCDLCNGTGKAKYFDFSICVECNELSFGKTCSLYMKCKKATGKDDCPNCADKSSSN